MVMKTKIFLTVIMFFAVTAIMNAQVADQGRVQGANQGNRIAWVDKDKNGICDNNTAGNPRGQGKGRVAGIGNGTGVCTGSGSGKGNRTGACKGVGRNSGTGFVDTDKDGVCDNFNRNAR
jgi:hypothetical protein